MGVRDDLNCSLHDILTRSEAISGRAYRLARTYNAFNQACISKTPVLVPPDRLPFPGHGTPPDEELYLEHAFGAVTAGFHARNNEELHATVTTMNDVLRAGNYLKARIILDHDTDPQHPAITRIAEPDMPYGLVIPPSPVSLRVTTHRAYHHDFILEKDGKRFIPADRDPIMRSIAANLALVAMATSLDIRLKKTDWITLKSHAPAPRH